MPRIDAGWKILEISTILELVEAERHKLVSLAITHGAHVVIEPSLVYIRSFREPFRIAIGIGSLIVSPTINVEDYLDKSKVLVMNRPEWVNTCILSEKQYFDFMFYQKQTEEIKEGKVYPYDSNNPIALFVTGAYAKIVGTSKDILPLAILEDGSPVVGFDGDRLEIYAIEGEAKERLDYIVPILSHCNIWR